jgi:hypothetical protein
MSDFLPKSYKGVPTNSNYMKLKDGENTFRILSPAIIGWEYWNNKGKPVRSQERWVKMPADIKVEQDGSTKIRHFWAFVVYNYEDKAIQILELTQTSVMTAIKALVDNKRWGDPAGYDITVKRSGKGFDTEYITQANPHSPIEDKILKEFTEKNIKLSALFDSGDPFTSTAEATLPITEEPEEEVELTDNDIPF